MFEPFPDDIFREREKQKHLRRYYGSAAEQMIPDSKKIPEGYKAPKSWHRPEKPPGTGNRAKRFTRTPETASADREAWTLYQAGHTGRQIAAIQGRKHYQAVYKGIARASRDRLLSGEALEEKTSYRGDKTSPVRPRTRPLDLSTIGIPVRYRGIRACGCYLYPKDRVTLISGRQHCIPCAMDHHGLSWRDIRRDPALLGKLKIPVVKPAIAAQLPALLKTPHTSSNFENR